MQQTQRSVDSVIAVLNVSVYNDGEMATFYNQQTNPAPLGYIKPVQGTPLRVTSNFTDLATATFQSLAIQAHPNNGGNIYILSNSAAADTVNGTNVLAILQAGQSLPLNGLALGGVQPSQFWIDADAANCIAIPIVYTA